jgi:hypothetical protein
MSYPNAQDYIHAVQDPAAAFRLPELRGAVFDLHPIWGIPAPAAGNAAVVFKAAVDGAATALRFFIREDASSRERYTALGRHFDSRGINDCVARAEWVDDAICLKGFAWPMVRMTWVEGRTLDAYVGHLASSGEVEALASLAEHWRFLVDRLQGAGFAHGDLQHGNVLVDTSSTLRLVDFDGSWLAEFGGSPPPNETGHPNYQRTGREWGRWMDTFPGLVIYTALLTLSRHPEARRLHTGENIVFAGPDFVPPFQTEAWNMVSRIDDPVVRHAADLLRQACQPGWRAADTLESLMSQRPTIVVEPPPQDRPDAGLYGGVPDAARRALWWQSTGGSVGPTPGVSPGSPVPAPRDSTARAMPPPPPKTERPMAGPVTPDDETPSFPGAPGTWAWHQPPTGPPGIVVGRRATQPRPPSSGQLGRTLTWLLLVVFAFLALVALADGEVSGAVVSGLIAVALALSLFLRRRGR